MVSLAFAMVSRCVAVLALLAVSVNAQYMMYTNYAATDNTCSGATSGQHVIPLNACLLINPGTPLPYLAFTACGGGSATAILCTDSACTTGCQSTTNPYGACNLAGSGKNYQIATCITSLPPLPASYLQVKEFPGDPTCSGPNAYGYFPLESGCVANSGTPYYQKLSACTSTGFTQLNCTDSACTSCPNSQTFSTTSAQCTQGTILQQVSCPSSSASSTGGSAASSTGSSMSSSGGSGLTGQYVVVESYLGNTCTGTRMATSIENVGCHMSQENTYYKATCNADGTTTTYNCGQDSTCTTCTTTQVPSGCQSEIFAATVTYCSNSLPTVSGYGSIFYQNQGCSGPVLSAVYSGIVDQCFGGSGQNGSAEITCTATSYTYKSCSDASCSQNCQSNTGSLGCVNGGNAAIVCGACGLKPSVVLLLVTVVAAVLFDRHSA